MSTKIYNAWKTSQPRVSVFELARYLRDQAFIAAREVIKKSILKLAASYNINKDPLSSWAKHIDGNVGEVTARLIEASGDLYLRYLKQFSKLERNTYDLSVSINIREKSGYLYLHAYADMEMKNVWDFLEYTPNLVSYEYWDNTDPPDGIPYERWEARGKEWDEVLKDKASLDLNVIDRHSILQAVNIYDPDTLKQMEKEYPKYAKQELWLRLANCLHTRPSMTEALYKRWFPRLMANAGQPCGPAAADFMWRMLKEREDRKT